MLAAVGAGDIAGAARVYEEFGRCLKADLDVEPSRKRWISGKGSSILTRHDEHDAAHDDPSLAWLGRPSDRDAAISLQLECRLARVRGRNVSRNSPVLIGVHAAARSHPRRARLEVNRR